MYFIYRKKILNGNFCPHLFWLKVGYKQNKIMYICI